jgi:hypothetical protein
MGFGHHEHNLFLLHICAGTITPPPPAHSRREGGSPIQAWQQEGPLPLWQPSKLQPTSILRLRPEQCLRLRGDIGNLEGSTNFLEMNGRGMGSSMMYGVATGFERHQARFVMQLCNFCVNIMERLKAPVVVEPFTPFTYYSLYSVVSKSCSRASTLIPMSASFV